MLILFFVYQIIINSLHENTPDSNLNKEVNQSQLYLPLLFLKINSKKKMLHHVSLKRILFMISLDHRLWAYTNTWITNECKECRWLRLKRNILLIIVVNECSLFKKVSCKSHQEMLPPTLTSIDDRKHIYKSK